MTEKRIQFSNIVHNQLPAYAREQFPLVVEFLSQYYRAQEFQGGPIDLIQNIDRYVKVDEMTHQIDSVILNKNINSIDNEIFVKISSSPTGTDGFPKKYGLLKIDEEIITYTGITTNSFTGCIRGFSGVDSLKTQNHPDQLVFSTSNSADHSEGSTIINLSSLFLKEFLLKTKYQLTPGFENRNLDKNLNDSIFIKQSKDFYKSKGTDESFKILFRSLYGEDVSIVRPKEYLFRPSDANYQITKDLVVESIQGNPENLINCTLIQDEYPEFTKAYAPITNVEKITSKNGKQYYKLSTDAGYSRDISFDGALYGEFKAHPQTKVIGKYTPKYFKVRTIPNLNSSSPLNVYEIDGTSQKQLTLIKGNTYRFDISDSSNNGHPFIFQTISGESLSSLYYSVVSEQTESFISLTISLTAPNEVIKYNCSNHNGMGANINIVTDSTDELPNLDVDSTVGFPNSGELYVTYNDQRQGIIKYESKSVNQFFKCSNITGIIEDSANVGINTYARKLPFKGSDEIIRVRVTSVIEDLNLIDDSYYLKKGISSQIKTLGVNSEDVVSNNWFFNIATSYEVQSISLIDNTDKTYQINTKLNNIFRIGDSLKIINSSGNEINTKVSDITSEKSFTINGNLLSVTDNYTVKRNILRTNSSTFPNSSIFSANVQNVYKQDNKTIVASPSLPYYNTQSLDISSKQIVFDVKIFDETYESDILKITDTNDHGFYTGDAVYYTPGSFSNPTNKNKLCDEGIYFIRRIDKNNIKLALSRANIYNSFIDPANDKNFIKFSGKIEIESNKLEYYKFKSKTLKSQNLFREISPPINDGKEYPTEPGFTGILINGVEISNYKSSDVLYYGTLNEIEITSPGFNYDVINPPVLSINDPLGSGAAGYCAVTGILNEIRVIDPGFDYVETPAINITGGNGVGAKAFASMKLVDHASSFYSESASQQVSLVDNTIGFSTYHKFRNAEKVIYDTIEQKGVGGISTDAAYFVSIVTPIKVKLHNTLDDAIFGINPINLTSYGTGNHQLRSFNKKSILGSINIENSGSGYENKKKTVISSITGINTSINHINILNHEYNSGEIIKYSTSGSIIGGLSNNTEYYLTKIDNNNFKLSEIGNTAATKDFYYKTKQFINLTSIGSGTHVFNYPEISVEIIGNVGISSIGNDTFKAIVQPIFRGRITSLHLESNGSNYGSPQILNYDKQPSITLIKGSGASVIPIISDGKIKEVLILSSGSGYNSPPNLVINGNGFGAVLTPIIENGALIEVKVIESGINYSDNTLINVISAGSLAEFNSKIQLWNVNLFQKNISLISGDDGFLSEGINENFELEYSHIYAPRKLREIVYSTDSGRNILYGKKDLIQVGNKEIQSTNHSPIIGWAYDGNPIYGPYGYSKNQGGTISQMKSGYKLNLKQNRPPTSTFPVGFFIEDYTHLEITDETVLDKNNGRFCNTPEYPNGTYAYFATISDGDADSEGQFSGYKNPIFPYLIGHNFNSRPNEFNFKKASNQNDFDLNKTSFSRNTNPYNLIESGASYSYLELPNLLNQTADIKYASPGSIEKISIDFGGFEYKVGDKLVFDNKDTSGYNASARVERIFGKFVNSISVATTSVSDVEFYPSGSQGDVLVVSKDPHNFANTSLISISGLNTTSSFLEGSYQIKTKTNTFALTDNVNTSIITGNIAYFSVAGNLNFSNIRENDILGIGTEQVKVLNVDVRSSRIRVLRAINGTVGSSHSVTDILYEKSRKFIINPGFKTQYNYKINREIYFNPSDVLGLGTTAGVGIGATLVFSNPGVGITQIFIPTRSIYIPNHQLNTGDKLIYSTNGGSPIGISINGISVTDTISDQNIVYVAKISEDLIGISTVKVGLGTQGTFVGSATTTQGMGILYFIGVGVGNNHSFKTTYDSLSGNITKNTVTVSTAQTHGLLNNNTVFVDVNSSISTTFTIRYNDHNRKVLVNPKSFISAGINTLTNTITIANHKFKHGQKVIHTASVPAGGLENNKEYFVSIVDTNNLKLADTYYDSINTKPDIVGITSASNGTLSLINPPIQVYKNSSIVFDLSDSSLSHTQQSTIYPAFDFKLFKDSNFTENYYSNFDDELFEVQKVGTVGVTSDAKVILSINENTPENLYYKLIPIYEGATLPDTKKLINEDSEVLLNNQIQISKSQYSGKYDIIVGSSTSFTYDLAKIPEENLYTSGISSIKYETNSLSANGPISKIEITNNGQNYYSIPRISDVKGGPSSGIGTGFILEPLSNSIGKIKSIKINDIGFDFPSDLTIRPSVAIPQVITIDPLSSFESITVSSFGKGYTSLPKLIVLDGKTKKIVPEVNLNLVAENRQVEILENTFGLNGATPTILPIQNTNGVPISSIQYNSNTKDVTVILGGVGFSTVNSFPFQVGDKVLIENVSVGISSTGKGYNSENYNYQLFTIKSVVENIGGSNGSVTYNINDFLSDSEFPGTFSSTNSTGRIIAQKQFPIFDIVLTKNNYFIGESVTSNSAVGTVEDWDSKSNLISIASKFNFKIGEIVKGSSSKTQGVAVRIAKFDAFFNLGSTSKFANGWKSDVGVLNDNLQRIQDNLYYQNFSYSIKSRVDFNTWNDAVSTLNHTSGFIKFSDYQLESPAAGEVGIASTALIVKVTSGSLDILSNIIEVVNLNCVNDFDLVKENSIQIGGQIISDEIIFSSRILTDYSESIGNRVLSIDDISSQFNSNPRPIRSAEVARLDIESGRTQKYITYVRDKRFTGERQLFLVTSLIDNTGNAYLNQYAKVNSNYDMGSFDIAIDGTEAVLLFLPTKFSVNDFDITTLSYNIDDNLLGIGSKNLGNVDIKSSSVAVSAGTTTTIIGIANTYRAVKVLVSVATTTNQYEFNELTIIHDGTNVGFLEYGQLSNHSLTSYSSTGFGTYYPYLSGSQLKVDFTPNVGIAVTVNVNTIQIAFATNTTVGVSTHDMTHARLEGRSTSIASTSTPTPVVIGEYPDVYDGGYFIVQASDNTNNIHQLSELTLVDDDNNVYATEYGIINTLSGLGTIGAQKTSPTMELTFTPLPNIDVDVKVYLNALRYDQINKDQIDLSNSKIQTNYGVYQGTDSDIRSNFQLTHKNDPIFERFFIGSASTIVNTISDIISIPNHFFVTGEEVRYVSAGAGTSQAIGIATTSFVSVGSTDKLPERIYIVKVDINNVKLARSAEDALKITPKTLDITSVGIGTSHRFVATNQNAKVIIAVDNVIQSPVVSTAVTTTLATNAITKDVIVFFNQTTSFFGGDLIKIGDEIMRIDGVGIGSTNAIQVRRPRLGTVISGHSTGSLVTKINGNYNIVDNVLNFVEAPYGRLPFSSITNTPSERDWVGISTGSSFQGRSFIRSGIINSSNETYYRNYIFNDISSGFNGITKEFILNSNGSNISGIKTENAIILINDIFQGPGAIYDYDLLESVGVTTVAFTGAATSVAYDINNASIPRGGIIVSVGSTEGFGYQPLVSAGGTATVSVAGTISAISIGNSGSGYRSGVQIVKVGVALSSTSTPTIEFIGTASVSNGSIVSIAITNPGTGYTSTNPPHVIFDDPISYSNIPLIYSLGSSGVGTQARVNIVVGQGSSVINFEIINTGYGYNNEEILTVPVGGATGIPTTGVSFNPFKVNIQKTFTDKFAGWSIGELQVLDSLDSAFDGKTTEFPLTLSGNLLSIRSAQGSNIDVQDTLLIFINDVLQVPGGGYVFSGGSVLRFTEPPKIGSNSKILFYRGSGSIDVIDVNILETVKVGDELTIGYDPSIGQSSTLQEKERTVTSINSTDLVKTNPYFGPGNVDDKSLIRRVKWCRQTEDKIIDGIKVTKDRMLYEAAITPESYLIKSVGIGNTVLYVDNIIPFFNPRHENNTNSYQDSVTLISQDKHVGAAATAVVSNTGTVTSIIINDSGGGYITAPTVSISQPIGFGTTASQNTALASATVSGGVVTGIAVTFSGGGYISTIPPQVLIEPPSVSKSKETNSVISYSGDSGIIVGFGTTSFSGNDRIIFDFYIPTNSVLRETSTISPFGMYVPTTVTVSGIGTNDYFLIYNSNVGSASTSIISRDINNDIIGFGTNFVDNVYQVESVSNVSVANTAIGIATVGTATTTVRRIYAKITGISTVTFSSTNITFDSNVFTFDSTGIGSDSGYSGGIATSNYFGNFSWGKIELAGRTKENTYNSYRNMGVGGISTSGSVRRTAPLRSKNYLIT